MKARIVPIGSSRGILIPKGFLERCNLGDTVELEVQDDRLVVRPVKNPRAGWDEAFRQMAEQGDDEPLDREALGQTEWERTAWEW